MTTKTLFAPFTVQDIMELLPGLSERAIKEVLREHKCACEIRGKLYVSLKQFHRLLEETELCHSRSDGDVELLNSSERLPPDAYERALELATRKSQKLEQRKGKRVLSAPKSTESTTKPPLPMLRSIT